MCSLFERALVWKLCLVIAMITDFIFKNLFYYNKTIQLHDLWFYKHVRQLPIPICVRDFFLRYDVNLCNYSPLLGEDQKILVSTHCINIFYKHTCSGIQCLDAFEMFCVVFRSCKPLPSSIFCVELCQGLNQTTMKRFNNTLYM